MARVESTIAVLAGLWLASGCHLGQFGAGAGAVLDIPVETGRNEFNETLVALSWPAELCRGATPTVTLEPDLGTGVSDETKGSRLILLGLAPETEYAFDLALELDGARCGIGSGTFVTGAMGLRVPRMELDVDDGTTTGWLMTTFATKPCGAALLYATGAAVWYSLRPA